MKKIIISGISAFAILFVILIINTISLKPKKIIVDEVEKLEISEDAINRFSGAIKFMTISSGNDSDNYTEEFLKLHEYLESVFPNIHSNLEKKVFNQSLLFKWQGLNNDLKPGLLMSHLDVVPVDNSTLKEWEAPPFSGEVKNGVIYGRGTLDDKVSVMGIMEAVESLINNGFKPIRTIYLAFGHDEEIGGNNGAGAIAKYLSDNNINLEFVLDEGGFVAEQMVDGINKPMAIINVAEKGYVSYKLTIKTQGGHSSAPPKDNTIGSLATAITKLESNQFKPRMIPLLNTQIETVGAELPFFEKMIFANKWLFKNIILEGFNAKTTIAPTIISGGVKDNVIPTTASVVVNFRIMTGDQPDEIKKHIINTIDDSRILVEEINPPNLPSPVSDFNSESFKLIEKTILQIIPDAITTPGLVGGGTDTKHYQKVSDNAYRFYPIRVNESNITGLHGINERMSIDNYKEIVQFAYQFLINLNNNDQE